MTPGAGWLGFVAGIVVLLLSVELVRRRHVRGRLALAWVVLGVVSVVFAASPAALTWLTRTLRVEVPLNLVLFAGVLFLLIVSMQQAGEIGRLEARTRRLAEEIAILSSRDDGTRSAGGGTRGAGGGTRGADDGSADDEDREPDAP